MGEFLHTDYLSNFCVLYPSIETDKNVFVISLGISANFSRFFVFLGRNFQTTNTGESHPVEPVILFVERAKPTLFDFLIYRYGKSILLTVGITMQTITMFGELNGYGLRPSQCPLRCLICQRHISWRFALCSKTRGIEGFIRKEPQEGLSLMRLFFFPGRFSNRKTVYGFIV